MTFGDFMFGTIGTALLLVFVFPIMLNREHRILSFLLAVVLVVLIIMPALYGLLYYFGGYP